MEHKCRNRVWRRVYIANSRVWNVCFTKRQCAVQNCVNRLYEFPSVEKCGDVLVEERCWPIWQPTTHLISGHWFQMSCHVCSLWQRHVPFKVPIC